MQAPLPCAAATEAPLPPARPEIGPPPAPPPLLHMTEMRGPDPAVRIRLRAPPPPCIGPAYRGPSGPRNGAPPRPYRFPEISWQQGTVKEPPQRGPAQAYRFYMRREIPRPPAAARRRAPVPEPPARRAPVAATGHMRVSGGRRKALQGAALAAVQSILRSVRIFLDTAASPCEPDSRGLLTAAGGLYTYALEEYGKMLLLGSLPKKGGIVSVSYREIFRSHRKFEAALGALPAECGQLKRGPFNPAIFQIGLNASFVSWTHLLYLDMRRDGHPIAPYLPDAEQFARAVAGLGRAVAEHEASSRRRAP